jgi:hypothetical protein
MSQQKGSWVAWIEPGGYVEVFQDLRTYVAYPQPPLGYKWKEGPELDALLKKGNARQVVRFVEPRGAAEEEEYVPSEA